MADVASEYIRNHSGLETAKTGSTPELSTQMQSTVQAFDEVTEKNLLPMGWHSPLSEYWHAFKAQPRREKAATVFLTLIGWLITAVALSLGAPFWFDTLNKFMVVRGHRQASGEKQYRKVERQLKRSRGLEDLLNIAIPSKNGYT